MTGGVFHFNLLNLPPQPKTVNNWVITRCKLLDLSYNRKENIAYNYVDNVQCWHFNINEHDKFHTQFN